MIDLCFANDEDSKNDYKFLIAWNHRSEYDPNHRILGKNKVENFNQLFYFILVDDASLPVDYDYERLFVLDFIYHIYILLKLAF